MSWFLLPVFQVALVAAPALHAQEQAKELPVKSLELVRQMSGWTIIVAPDGSGTILYGSTAGDFALFPKGTVDFEKLLATVKTRKKVDADDPSRVQVIVNTAERPPTQIAEPKDLAAEWEAMCVQISKNLHAQDPERIELLLEHTPLGKEKPAEKTKVKKFDPSTVMPRPPRPRKEK